MTDKEGGFFSAEDADSEGKEGTFYFWTKKELVEILGEKNGKIMAEVYGLLEMGNFHDEATAQTTGKNIPYLQDNRNALAKEFDITLNELNEIIENSRKKLFNVRQDRVHPQKDDKILTDWNGLMIAAFALGGQILNEPEYINAAKKAAEFVHKKLRNKNSKLFKSYRNGKSGLSPHLDDYSFMVWGLLNLYEGTFNVEYLSRALELTEVMNENFSDENGGFFIGSKDAEKLMVRAKFSYDSAIPSGNSVAVMNLFRLSKMTGNKKWTNLAEKTLKAFTDEAKQTPTGFAHMLTGFMFDLKEPKEVVVVANSYNSKTKKLVQKLKDNYCPNKVIIFKDLSDPKRLEEIAPWISDYSVIDNKPTYYICENFTCKRPTTNIKTVLNYLSV